ncbi:unnamed protein product [Urochloa decumbens]|uniref:RING-type E3 ubiquitin transferase n=1 Tax=Urochloa decumbens TaxID=240449 RepID=A0ABC9BE48_9POAL
MGAERARRWKLFPSFRSLSLPPASPSSKRNKHRPPSEPDVPLPAPSSPAAREEAEEEVPAEFLCPILRAPMADPVILPSGRTYERACVRACAELGLSLTQDGVAAAEGNATSGDCGGAVAIPNDALRAAVRTWCARSGRAPPLPPSAETAREAVLRAVPAPRPPPERAASNVSVSSESALAPARSASNLSCSSEGASTSSSSSSSARSSREMAAAELDVARGKAAAKEKEKDKPEEPAARVADAEEEAVIRAVEAGKDSPAEVVEATLSALRRATRESPARRRALCASPRLLASLRRVLSSRRHTPSARADAAAALANLTLEPENRVPLVRAGAVPALVDAVASSAAEAQEHAAGALFGLALHEGNRAAIGVLGAVPPLIAVLTGRDGQHALPQSARQDAGMALYHLSLAAVNQSKLARAQGAARSLLAVASDGGEPAAIRRLALMVACNVAGCAEGRAALMDAGAVAAASGILSAAGGDGSSESELQEWCVAALYAMSKGSPRFRGLARAAGADRPLMLFAEQASPGVCKEMAQAALRAILGLADNSEDDDQISECRSSDGSRGASNRVPHRRRVASWSAPPPATPASSHQWRSVCID